MNSKVTVLQIDNALASARISLFGGQVLSFCPRHDKRERLFLSSKALLDGSKSIRGGIPICWPWFGAYKGRQTGLPSHGYARTRRWDVVDINDTTDGTEVLLEMEDTSGAGFNGTAQVQALITVGRALTVALYTTNQGSEPFELGAALHTYFAIDDIAQTTLQGLSGTYSDKTRNWAMLDTPTPYPFTAETDRIHLTSAPKVEIASNNAVTGVVSSGHDSVVVWNPWADGSKAFADLEADDYRRFVCVETALTQGYKLAPGERHCLQQTIV
ncbi:MAG: D-hexose-6-phosphate mutarotase [Pseudomonadota bacterium]